MKNMLTRLVIILLFTAVLFYGTETWAQKSGSVSRDSMRTIVDLAGNEIALPPAKDLRRIVIIAPPLVSTFVSLGISGARIVGAHKTAFDDANHELLDRVLPYWKEIPTDFIAGYTANTEALLNLHPDIIFVYGNFQKKGLQTIGIPIVDFFTTNYDNEFWSVAIEKLMKIIFQMENSRSSVENEWKKTHERIEPVLKKMTGKKSRGLMILNNTINKITIRGGGTYGDDWLVKSGLTNVAAHLKGEGKEVSMEQIYRWNPDVIYVFRGRPASDYLGDRIENQDWSFVKAYKQKAIYDCPRGMMNWGAPNVDSPLMLQWMVSKNYKGEFDGVAFPAIMKTYYHNLFGISLSHDIIQSILFPNGQ
ncbi:MAG: ABC transporter substrate-binding protein [Desulfobacterium sp.]